MLVLGRKVEESFMIGDDIRIHITRISADQVRIGIEAPPHLRVIRTELLDQFAPLAAHLANKVARVSDAGSITKPQLQGAAT
jgi:carbon storage regulator